MKADDNMSHKDIIQDNLTKSDPNLEIKAVMEEKEVYRVIGKLTYRLTSCAYCHTRSIVKNGFKTVYIRDIPFNGKPVILQIDKQRFLCKACHRSTIAQTNF
ncbi:transposase family protein [Pediococcus acidilactici]|uniref:transposase family protein n=1 Tax=Pediococcus acidilactici TaxID=1254 RepID=UPI0013309F8D|nr:transposase family protein [Pediococcus acidilactici]MBW4798048.1 transposase family protein [Pediococcus acidilactici]MCE5962553.1 transposase family protein [Pediococcus acidilactici]MCJ2192105.1 transposase family protein [Pediococcus acidilactici]MCW8083649.1 transposase family protein [Pediococcus acidilactici]MDB8857780.1 transposase family protein [Pediococcus acidilactici]